MCEEKRLKFIEKSGSRFKEYIICIIEKEVYNQKLFWVGNNKCLNFKMQKQVHSVTRGYGKRIKV